MYASGPVRCVEQAKSKQRNRIVKRECGRVGRRMLARRWRNPQPDSRAIEHRLIGIEFDDRRGGYGRGPGGHRLRTPTETRGPPASTSVEGMGVEQE
jgi:hypothetical protein